MRKMYLKSLLTSISTMLCIAPTLAGGESSKGGHEVFQNEGEGRLHLVLRLRAGHSHSDECLYCLHGHSQYSQTLPPGDDSDSHGLSGDFSSSFSTSPYDSSSSESGSIFWDDTSSEGSLPPSERLSITSRDSKNDGESTPPTPQKSKKGEGDGEKPSLDDEEKPRKLTASIETPKAIPLTTDPNALEKERLRAQLQALKKSNTRLEEDLEREALKPQKKAPPKTSKKKRKRKHKHTVGGQLSRLLEHVEKGKF